MRRGALDSGACAMAPDCRRCRCLMARMIVTDRDAAPEPSRLGGKAASLATLVRAGFPVPRWMCLTADGLAGGMPDGAAVLARFDELFGPGGRVAVRSSAVGEDGAVSSYAGQMESYLNVPREELLGRIVECHASAGAARVKLYREARGEADGAG